jgi:hypothetical protein
MGRNICPTIDYSYLSDKWQLEFIFCWSIVYLDRLSRSSISIVYLDRLSRSSISIVYLDRLSIVSRSSLDRLSRSSLDRLSRSFTHLRPRCNFTLELHLTTSPYNFTLRLHPRTSPYNFTLELHPRTSPHDFTLRLHPIKKPRIAARFIVFRWPINQLTRLAFSATSCK